MLKLANIFRLPGLHLFLFYFFFAFFGWPIMTIVEKTRNYFIFIYIFLVWGIIILFMFLIAGSLKRIDSGKIRKSEREEITDV